MGKSPYDITVPPMPGSTGASGEEERSEPAMRAELQFRVGKVWVCLLDFPGIPEARGSRRALIDMASRSNGPDAAQYMRAHTRVAEVTVIAWTAVIPGG